MTSISDLGLDLSTTPSSLGEKGQAGRENNTKSSVKSARWSPDTRNPATALRQQRRLAGLGLRAEARTPEGRGRVV